MAPPVASIEAAIINIYVCTLMSCSIVSYWAGVSEKKDRWYIYLDIIYMHGLRAAHSRTTTGMIILRYIFSSNFSYD